jgi:drug/metabolite transporter (DMT)-like permease
MFYWSIVLVVLGNVLYQVSQKSIPRGLDPVFSVFVSYLTALALTALLLPWAASRPLRESWRATTWASFGVGVGACVIEFAVLWVYRSGWSISVAPFVAGAGLAALLIPIGVLLYRERISGVNAVGLLLCLIGVYLASRR